VRHALTVQLAHLIGFGRVIHDAMDIERHLPTDYDDSR
jgi:hypothetical protein